MSPHVSEFRAPHYIGATRPFGAVDLRSYHASVTENLLSRPAKAAFIPLNLTQCAPPRPSRRVLTKRTRRFSSRPHASSPRPTRRHPSACILPPLIRAMPAPFGLAPQRTPVRLGTAQRTLSRTSLYAAWHRATSERGHGRRLPAKPPEAFRSSRHGVHDSQGDGPLCMWVWTVGQAGGETRRRTGAAHCTMAIPPSTTLRAAPLTLDSLCAVSA